MFLVSQGKVLKDNKNKRSRSYEGNVFQIKKGEKEEPMDTFETEEDLKKKNAEITE